MKSHVTVLPANTFVNWAKWRLNFLEAGSTLSFQNGSGREPAQPSQAVLYVQHCFFLWLLRYKQTRMNFHTVKIQQQLLNTEDTFLSRQILMRSLHYISSLMFWSIKRKKKLLTKENRYKAQKQRTPTFYCVNNWSRGQETIWRKPCIPTKRTV